jgi:hypothetical protein
MDDEDKIILAGLGTFGALTYIAIKELEEREALESAEDEAKIQIQEKELELNEGFSKKREITKETPIYKDIIKFIKERRK